MNAKNNTFKNSAHWKDILFLTLVMGALYSFLLGVRPFSTPDEGRYVEIAREMRISEDYVTPRLNGIKYFEKPPLFYWLQAETQKVLGTGETAMRLWPTLMTLLSMLMVYGIGTYYRGRLTGLLSALVFGTSLQVYSHARIIILDIPVSFFLTVALFCFLRASQAPPEKTQQQVTSRPTHQNLFLFLFFLSTALATLTKGLMAIVIVGAVILLWTLIYKRYQALALAFKPWGILLFLGVAVPWHVMAHLKNPEFSYFYFVHEHFLRYLTPVHGRSQPFYFFIGVFALGFFPWIFHAYHTFKHTLEKLKIKETQGFYAYLALWIFFILGFFSLSDSKLIPYILPLYPPVSLLLGASLSALLAPIVPENFCLKHLKEGWNQKLTTFSCLKLPLRLFAGLCGVLVCGLWVGTLKENSFIIGDITPYALLASTALALGAALTLKLSFSKPTLKATIAGIVLPTLTAVFFFLILTTAWPLFERPSTKPLVPAIQKAQAQGATIVTYHRYYYDLPLYLNQKIPFVEWSGEFEFGLGVEKEHPLRLWEADFKKLWEGPQKVCAVLREDVFEKVQTSKLYIMHIIQRYKNNLLVCNTPSKQVVKP